MYSVAVGLLPPFCSILRTTSCSLSPPDWRYLAWSNWLQPICTRMNSLKWPLVTPAWLSTWSIWAGFSLLLAAKRA